MKHCLFLQILQTRPAYRRPKTVQFRLYPGCLMVYPINSSGYIRADYGKAGTGLIRLPLD
jgi:hypothetical protein